MGRRAFMIYIAYLPRTRLGNWLYQLCAAYSTGQEVAFYCLGSDEVRQALQKHLKKLVPSLHYVLDIPEALPRFEAPKVYEPLPDTVKTGDWLFCGLFMDEHYCQTPGVQERFAIPRESLDHLRDKYAVLAGECCVGVSVRRGDYMKIQYRLPFVGKRFLRQAVELFPQATGYLIGSDDIPWCRRFFTSKRFPGKTFMFLDEDPVTQIYGFALCKHNILANSSFSWWGAWLNPTPNKIIVGPKYYSGFAKPGVLGLLLTGGRRTVRRTIHNPMVLTIENPDTPLQAILALFQYYWNGIRNHTYLAFEHLIQSHLPSLKPLLKPFQRHKKLVWNGEG